MSRGDVLREKYTGAERVVLEVYPTHILASFDCGNWIIWQDKYKYYEVI